MSKQFITNILGLFPEAFTEILYGRETQHNGRIGGSSWLGGYKNQRTHAWRCEPAFVSSPEVDILGHYHMEPP